MNLEKSLIEASYYFASDVLGIEIELFESCPLGETYNAYIDINGETNKRVFVHIPHKALVRMAYLFLYEEDPDQEVLTDLTKEIANVIIGRAKVTAQSYDLQFDISTPTYDGYSHFDASQNIKRINFTFEDEIFSITIYNEAK